MRAFVEPVTARMIAAAFDACQLHTENDEPGDDEAYAAIYRAMRAVSPDVGLVKALCDALEISRATINRLEVKHGTFSSVRGTLDVIDAAIAKVKGE